MKSLTLYTHGCLRTSLTECSSFSLVFITILTAFGTIMQLYTSIISLPYFVVYFWQWRNHTRAITGSARVGFISARAVARPENELGVLCLSITNQDVFRFKTAV